MVSKGNFTLITTEGVALIINEHETSGGGKGNPPRFERERSGRRNEYPMRVMMQSFIAAYIYQISVKNELIRELRLKHALTNPAAPVIAGDGFAKAALSCLSQ